MSAAILLASTSPRRRELFHHLGLPFDTCGTDVDEALLPGEAPEAAVRRLAEAKAHAARAAHGHDIVIGADTLVALGGQVLGKPQDAAEARAMLAWLSGREHEVWTGVCVQTASGGETFAECTRVRFRPLTPEEIVAYVATGEPLDKAGAYGIQERGAVFVEGVQGDFFNVVGLPLCRLHQVLTRIIPPS